MILRKAWWMVLLLPMSAQPQSATGTDYLVAARGVAAWLTEVTGNGQRWPARQTPAGQLISMQQELGLETGAAGIGLFFTTLHRHSGDSQHLQMAIKAAEFERSRHQSGVYGSTDYLAGAAGSGLFLLALHARTGDPRYLAWAQDIADWHEQVALSPAPGQRYWEITPGFFRTYVGLPHGATGIAIFHLSLYQRTGEPRLLAMAEDAYRWVRTHALPIGTGDAIGFRRLVTDGDRLYTWWSGGSAGVLLLQAQLYGVTGNAHYLDELRRTADGLVATSMPSSPPGSHWTTDGGTGTYRPHVFSHGNAGVPPALLLAHEHVADPMYRNTAIEGADWLRAVARDGAGVASQGLYWTHSTGGGFSNLRLTGAFVGTASVGWSFARMHRLTGDERMRDIALASADHLVSTAERDGAAWRWPNYFGVEDPNWDPVAYNTGWYDGAAGIGLFMLAAHELANGALPRLDVH